MFPQIRYAALAPLGNGRFSHVEDGARRFGAAAKVLLDDRINVHTARIKQFTFQVNFILLYMADNDG